MARARPAVRRARCGIISSRRRMPAVRKPRYSEDVCLSMAKPPGHICERAGSGAGRKREYTKRCDEGDDWSIAREPERLTLVRYHAVHVAKAHARGPR